MQMTQRLELLSPVGAPSPPNGLLRRRRQTEVLTGGGRAGPAEGAGGGGGGGGLALCGDRCMGRWYFGRKEDG